MICDLHCHTTSSDGTCSPGELVRMADRARLAVLAITDHDCITACAEAQAVIVRENLNVSLLKGVELSVDCTEGELHIVGLAIDDSNRQLQDRLAAFKHDREQRIYKIAAKLEELGYQLQVDEVLAQATASTKTIGRPHVAAALVKKGYFDSVQDVFNKLLSTDGPAYVNHLKPSLDEAIKLVHAAKGQAIIAHPYKTSRLLIEQAVALGVDGLEVYYPEHTPEMVAGYKQFARERELKISGGSDFHGVKGRYPSRLGIYSLSVQMLNLW